MKFRLLIILLVINLSCKKEYKIENPNEIWTKSEILELNSIIKDFDKVLFIEYKTKSTKDAYTLFSKTILEKGGVPELKGFKELSMNVKKSEVFNKIWVINTDSANNDEYFVLKYNSNYQKFLYKVGEKSDFMKVYAEKFEVSGDILPSIIAGFANNIENLDLEDINNKLIFVIHYLSLLNR